MRRMRKGAELKTMDRIINNLHLGDIDDLKDEKVREQVDFILNLSSHTDPVYTCGDYTYLHLHINDGAGNYHDFKTAVEAVVYRLQNTDDEVLVNCAMGISRSVTVVATAVAIIKGTGFQYALDKIQDSRGINQNPVPELTSMAEKLMETYQ